MSLSLLLVGMPARVARADILDLVNGDHYQGTIISVTQSNVEFQSEIQGHITLPRSKVARMTLGSPATVQPTTNTAPAAGPSLIMQGTNHVNSGIVSSSPDAVLQQMRNNGLDPKLVSQVQAQVIGQGNPAAAQKFDELMDGLMSGSLSIQDIRAQAQESIGQIEDAKRELGPDIGDMFDGYLAILQNFVSETATNDIVSPAPASSPASGTTPAK